MPISAQLASDHPGEVHLLGGRVRAIEAETGRRPARTTGGGTSDARFIKNYAAVCEFGLVGATMHQVDERVPAAQVRQLKDIYQAILARYFA